MLSKCAMALVAPFVGALACALAMPPMVNAAPIVVNVTGNITSYHSYHYDYSTNTFSYDYSGSTGTLSGTFTWDPALMGADLSTPPSLSYHDDSPGANVWLTSSLTAVTPDYTQTYNPSSSLFPLAQQYLQGLDGNISGYGFLQPSLHHCCNATVGQDNFSGYATNYFYFSDYTSPFTPTLGSQSGQFVPTAVDYTPNGPDNYGSLFAVDFRYRYDGLGNPIDETLTMAEAVLISATSTTSAVPEPSSVLLLGSGLMSAMGLGAWRRRQRHVRQPS